MGLLHPKAQLRLLSPYAQNFMQIINLDNISLCHYHKTNNCSRATSEEIQNGHQLWLAPLNIDTKTHLGKYQLLCKGLGCRTPEVINTQLPVTPPSLYSHILTIHFFRKKIKELLLFTAVTFEGMSAASLQWNHDDVDFMKEV